MSSVRSVAPRLSLRVDTAAELMTANPVSIPGEALILEAVTLLTEKGFSAAPVIDEAGRPVGVISRTDILIYDRERGDTPAPAANDAYEADLDAIMERPFRSGFRVQTIDQVRVADIMTPVVFCVSPTTAASQVVAQLLGLNVRRLFVVDDNEILVGVISERDVLRHLRP